MRKVWAVVRREFVERVRSRWFWIMALVGPLFFGAVFVLPAVLARGGGVKDIAVVDATAGPLGRRITDSLNAGRTFAAVRVPAGDRVVDSLTAEVEHKRLSGFLILTDAAVDSGKVEYRGSNVSGFGTVGALERVVAEAVHVARLERAGVDPRVVAEARIPIHLATERIAGGTATSETAAQSFSLAYFMGIILYTAILLYGINVMSSVLEEKTTRIVEVLVSSLRPFQLMLGKVLGVGAVSILQFLIWGLGARLLLARRASTLAASGPMAADEVFQVPHVSGATLGIFMAYFLGGFFLYSAMFAAVGAMSSTEQEARQAQQPVAWLLVLSFVSMFAMLNDPNSTLAVTLSLVPLSAPIAMPVRWAAGSIPGYEIALSLVILVASIVAVTWIAARIYRVGILMTGKRPSIRELARWVKTA
jgi:ABC-2 type transport system permease protein